MSQPTIPLLVGAYPIPFDSPRDRDAFDAGLLELGVDGLELPDTELLGSDGAAEMVANRLRAGFQEVVVTAIPGTMSRQGAVPGSGLASEDESLRATSVRFIADVLRASSHLQELVGLPCVRALLVHSAPTREGSAGAFGRSLHELVELQAGLPTEQRIRLAIEHCDALRSDQPGQKMFLGLDDELALAGELGLGVTINWGRSAIEGRSVETPVEHVTRCAQQSLLAGLSFSGAGPDASPFGGEWADAHLPMHVDEPASLMSAQSVQDCLAAAEGREWYRCVKVKAKKEESVEFKIGLVRSVIDAIHPE